MNRRATDMDARIGIWLREERLARGMTQPDLARMLGVSFQQIQKYEQGGNRISASRLFQIVAAFGANVGDVMGSVLSDMEPRATGPALKPQINIAYDRLSSSNQKLVLDVAKALAEEPIRG